MRKKFIVTPPFQQRGFLAVLAVVMVVIIGFIGVAIAEMYYGASKSTTASQQADNALFIAESGLEKATRFIGTPFVTGTTARIGCASVAGSSGLTNTSFGNGTFTATTANSTPIYVKSTLSSAITSSSTSIPVANTAGFAPAGRIMIDYEIINYGGISGNNFIGVQRGTNKNYNTSHATGAAVSQYQCDLDVKAGIPNLVTPLYQREAQQSYSLQEAWAVGNASGSSFIFTRWNRPTEIAWTNSAVSSGSPTNLKAVSMLSYAEGWAVGDSGDSNFLLLHWTGSSWSTSTPASLCSGQSLLGVSAVSSQEAWAVGAQIPRTSCSSSPYRYAILRWNGTTWTALSSATTPSIPADSNSNQTLNAVHVIGTNGNSTGNLGFAVGTGGVILQYNGTSWTSVTSPTTNNLFGVYVVSGSEAWAVGAAGTIIKWNGTNWSSVTSPTGTRLNSISMLDATLSGAAQSGWAVGNAGVAVAYDGSNWSSQNTGSGSNLKSVAMFFNSADTWAVGTSGTIMHWDGSAWSSITSNVTQTLTGISPVISQPFPFAWQEIYA
jgi:Tfp pilus assembly protein PilX